MKYMRFAPFLFLTFAVAAFACGSDASDAASDSGVEPDAGPTIDASVLSPDGTVPAVDAATKDAAPLKDAAGVTTWQVPTEPPDCDPGKPFAAGVQVPTPSNLLLPSNVTLSPDELSAYYVYGADVYKTERVSRTAPFGNAVLVQAVGTSASTLAISADGLTLVLEEEGTTQDLTIARRASVLDPFGPRQPFLKLFPAEARMPFLRKDGAEVFFYSYSGNSYTVGRAPVSNGVIGTVETIAHLGDLSGGNVTYASNPVLSFDGLTLFYSRGASIVSATRPSAGAAFVLPPTEHPALTMSVGDFYYPYWLSPDGCRLYYGKDTRGLWVTSRGK